VQEGKKDVREKRKSKKAKRREAIQKASRSMAGDGVKETEVSDEERGSDPLAHVDQDSMDLEDEWEELKREDRMAKKVKLGLIEKEVFEKAFAIDDI
jgi:ATP-dependent RNA helicase DDX55/SPB4